MWIDEFPDSGEGGVRGIMTQSRRQFLRDSFCGFGSLAFAALQHQEHARAQLNPLAPRPPHRPEPKAKAVIFLFMAGGPSHLETFDPKPLLNKLGGEKGPPGVGGVRCQNVKNKWGI